MNTNTVPRPEHPQPMMKRESWQNLNGEWLFEFDFGNSGEERGLFKPENSGEYTKKITVPFAPKVSFREYAIRILFRRFGTSAPLTLRMNSLKTAFYCISELLITSVTCM